MTNRLPRTKKNKIGFVISISTGDEDERKKITEDFVRTLHELLKRGPSGSSFQFINIPEHFAEKVIDTDDAQELRVRCRAHFVLFGRVRLRTVDGRQEHIISLDGLVAHNPVPKMISEKLAKEFSELLPRRVRIAVENDVFHFAFTSEWINCVAKYIIGIAAGLSGDIDYAEVLFNEVDLLLREQNPTSPVFLKLKQTLRQRIPQRMAEINETRAKLAIETWFDSHDLALMEEAGRHLAMITAPYSDEYRIILLRSIFMFVQNRDVQGAINILKKCKNILNGTAQYNLAFLYAYKGDLQKAIRHYRNAIKLDTDPSNFAKIEEFILWVIEVEPHKYQLHYCLGFINWQVKGDGTQAIRDLSTFLSSGVEGEFAEERHIVKKWISEIEKAQEESSRQTLRDGVDKVD